MHTIISLQDKQRIVALQLSVALHDIGFNLTQIANQTGLAVSIVLFHYNCILNIKNFDS